MQPMRGREGGREGGESVFLLVRMTFTYTKRSVHRILFGILEVLPAKVSWSKLQAMPGCITMGDASLEGKDKNSLKDLRITPSAVNDYTSPVRPPPQNMTKILTSLSSNECKATRRHPQREHRSGLNDSLNGKQD